MKRELALAAIAVLATRMGACREFVLTDQGTPALERGADGSMSDGGHGSNSDGGHGSNSDGAPSGAGSSAWPTPSPDPSGGQANTAPPDGGSSGSGAENEPSLIPPNEATGGLALWLEAGVEGCELDGDGRVATWMDWSGHGNHAAKDERFEAPLLVSDAIRGHAAVKFDSDPSVLVVPDADSIRLARAPFTLFLVARWRNERKLGYNGSNQLVYEGMGAILSKVTLDFPFTGIAVFANYPTVYPGVETMTRLAVQMEFGSALALSYSNALNDDIFRLVVVQRRSAVDVAIRINGQEEGGVRVSSELSASAPGQPLKLGGWSGSPFRGELAEVVWMRGDPQQSNWRGVERFLMAKYEVGVE